MRVLSGIQPTGEFHVGNYFGAMRQYVDLQKQADNDCYYFIANYHALTSIREPELLRSLTQDVLLNFLAFGIDPDRSVLFRQSDVPEVTELTWILSCITPMGLLERCHAYKDKVSQGLPADHGLFAYPVLMASDILIYDSNLVPVGQDQKQHVEVTRDLAIKFNQMYGETLVVPEPYILENVAVVPGVDGRKMSKSYDNTIPVFADDKVIKKRIMSIVTDSTPVEDPKDPDTCNVFALYKLFAAPEETAEMAERYRAGGVGYGEVKKRLVALFFDYFAEARARKRELLNDPGMVEEMARAGAAKARAKAREVLDRCRSAAGF
ncbi:MAG: tryptophan--tRNA ligase [Acidobacteriota bacterium]|jgi:tryptophanyl-tRNA synthetase|nr:tryptophan--tRNA ligase [Acidobacteriota bacterium]